MPGISAEAEVSVRRIAFRSAAESSGFGLKRITCAIIADLLRRGDHRRHRHGRRHHRDRRFVLIRAF
jgi:hypothetical protein